MGAGTGYAVHAAVRAVSRARRAIYVCHPYSGDVMANIATCAKIARSIVDEGHLPMAPQLYLGRFIDERTERETAMDCCLTMLRNCDEIRVYGDRISPGMRREINLALELDGIDIVFVETVP